MSEDKELTENEVLNYFNEICNDFSYIKLHPNLPKDEAKRFHRQINDKLDKVHYNTVFKYIKNNDKKQKDFYSKLFKIFENSCIIGQYDFKIDCCIPTENSTYDVSGIFDTTEYTYQNIHKIIVVKIIDNIIEPALKTCGYDPDIDLK